MPWNNDDKVEKWLALALGLVVVVGLIGAACGLSWTLADILGVRFAQVWRVCWTAKMVSMRNSDGVRGSFSSGIFMTSGNINSRQFYYYYTQDESGAFRPHQWEADSSTYVFQENRKDGVVFQYEADFKRPWVHWIASPIDSIKMEFRIPEGSLTQTFHLE